MELPQITFRDILTAFIYLKPGKTGFFVEDAFAFGIRKTFEGNADYQWLFERHGSAGSCGATHTSLDTAIENLFPWRVAYSSDYQFCHLTPAGKSAAGRIEKELGQDFAKLKPVAADVWQKAQEFPGMYNRPSLYQ